METHPPKQVEVTEHRGWRGAPISIYGVPACIGHGMPTHGGSWKESVAGPPPTPISATATGQGAGCWRIERRGQLGFVKWLQLWSLLGKGWLFKRHKNGPWEGSLTALDKVPLPRKAFFPLPWHSPARSSWGVGVHSMVPGWAQLGSTPMPSRVSGSPGKDPPQLWVLRGQRSYG